MAKKQEKRTIILDNGEQAEALFPVIVSASRSTDIPAFYADWFFNRLKKGYSAWINPFNGKKYYIAYEDCKFIVFWSKNPEPLLTHLDYLNSRGIGCYINFTLNDYENEGLECNVPPLAKRIAIFRTLANRLGKEAVIWRFDPLVLTETTGIAALLARIANIGRLLHEYTEKLVFSFADILQYRKVKANMVRNGVPFRDWTEEQMLEFSQKLLELNRSEGWNLRLATCAEAINLPGIEHNKCMDARLILGLAPGSRELWNFLAGKSKENNSLLPTEDINTDINRYEVMEKNNRDRGQRTACNCIKSKDIGEYNTCPHLCAYCYANYSRESAQRNYLRHQHNPQAETISGK